jgi:hypothetical protein
MTDNFSAKFGKSAYFCKLGNITKRGGGSVAHSADDIQKQSKTFYLLFI